MGTVPAHTRVGGATRRAAVDHAQTVYAEAYRWIARTDHDAFVVATRTALWPRWLAVATAEPATLTEPGDSADGTLVVGRRTIPVRWTVRRRLRDIVALDAIGDGRTVGRMVIGFGRWFDGSVAELRLTSSVGSRLRLRRALRRSLGRLDELVTRPGRAAR